MKPCTRCDSWEPDRGYYPDARNADGLSGVCKACQCRDARDSSRRRYTVKNTMSQVRDARGQFARAVT